MKRRSAAVLLGGAALSAACFSLDVNAIQPVTGINFTRDSIFKDPLLAEQAVAGSFVNFWSGINLSNPWTILSIWGEEITTSTLTASGSIWEHVSEPRSFYNNEVNGNRVGRDPWGFFYEANSMGAELGGHVRRNNLKVIDRVSGADNTQRFLIFARWIQGMSHLHLGLLFDSAAIVTDDMDLSKPVALPLRPYTEVTDSAIVWLQEVIDSATVYPFILPLNDDLWIYNVSTTSENLIAISHSYIARALVYRARTPAERAAVDWEQVKFHASRGITAPFGPRGDPPNAFQDFEYRIATTSAPRAAATNDNMCAIGNSNVGCSRSGVFRVDIRVLGPADTTGNYQQWLDKVSQPGFDTVAPIDIGTPDQRIQPPGGTDPGFAPVYFKHATSPTGVLLWPNSMDTAARGKYYVSNYWNSTRARDNRTQWPATGGGKNRNNSAELQFIQDDMMVPAEMRLLLAEANIRSSSPDLAAAAALINQSRTQNGELPEVTTAGVPQSAGCVPRRWDGSCGDLFDALVYEKRIETYGTAIAFFDARGWGCLLEGTPTQLPVPGQQLLLQNQPVYTYGGQPGQVGTATKPNNCPLMFKPT